MHIWSSPNTTAGRWVYVSGLRTPESTSTCRLVRDTEVQGPDRFDFLLAPQTGFNAPAAQLSLMFRARGPNVTMSSESATGIDAVAYAADFIRNGRAAVMFAGGIDLLSLTVATLGEGHGMECLSPKPFDRHRVGPLPGEAACVLVLEEARRAKERGAHVLAEVAGSGSAFAGMCSHADAAIHAIHNALGDASTNPRDISAVFASASGDRACDGAAAAAISSVLGGTTPVNSVKGVTGECRAASGALQIAAALFTFADGVLPPTTGFETPDPDLPLLSIATRPVPWDGRQSLIHCLDPKGHSSALVLNAVTHSGPLHA